MFEEPLPGCEVAWDCGLPSIDMFYERVLCSIECFLTQNVTLQALERHACCGRLSFLVMGFGLMSKETWWLFYLDLIALCILHLQSLPARHLQVVPHLRASVMLELQSSKEGRRTELMSEECGDVGSAGMK